MDFNAKKAFVEGENLDGQRLSKILEEKSSGQYKAKVLE
ncbi:MAG: hypothetical protein D6785_13810 [Planctomycetota bacterium]|nr:MAG: hypothetical protein D6785_13810 [Planctomycetota bacterium]